MFSRVNTLQAETFSGLSRNGPLFGGFARVSWQQSLYHFPLLHSPHGLTDRGSAAKILSQNPKQASLLAGQLHFCYVCVHDTCR